MLSNGEIEHLPQSSHTKHNILFHWMSKCFTSTLWISQRELIYRQCYNCPLQAQFSSNSDSKLQNWVWQCRCIFLASHSKISFNRQKRKISDEKQYLVAFYFAVLPMGMCCQVRAFLSVYSNCWVAITTARPAREWRQKRANSATQLWG